MGIRVSWDNEDKTATRYDFHGQWDWNEFYAAVNEGNALLNSVEHQVDTIANLAGNSTWLPSGAITHVRRVRLNSPKNAGIVVVAHANTFIKTMVTLFRKVDPAMGAQFFTADSLEEARRILATQRTLKLHNAADSKTG